MDTVKSLHFTDQYLSEIRSIIENSYSVREVLLRMQLRPAGGNYKIFYNYIKKHLLNTSHFTGKGHNKNKRGVDVRGGIRNSLDKVLQNPNTQSFKLKRRLLKEEIFPHRCSNCNLTTWLENPIPLELDHIDGNHANNSLHNLRLLCPNCHTLTPTYRGRNRKQS